MLRSNTDIKEITQRVKEANGIVDTLLAETAKTVVGQKNMLEKIVIALLCDGHALLEGVPGLAKTLAVKTLANAISASFKRIQFTPDLLPADVIGTQIYNQQRSEFSTRKGPIFANFVLADEINRAPAKVQSAFLEAMEERQVTIGDTTYPLDLPFMALATQNPIEHEGVYALPEAQLDRFMFKILVTYPTKEEEKEIVKRMSVTRKHSTKKVMHPSDIERAKSVVECVHTEDRIIDYIMDVIEATRRPGDYGLPSSLIEYGASPRASVALMKGARAHAFIRGRGFVTPEDVRAIGYDALRHRVVPSYEADAEGITSDDIILRVFNAVEVP